MEKLMSNFLKKAQYLQAKYFEIMSFCIRNVNIRNTIEISVKIEDVDSSQRTFTVTNHMKTSERNEVLERMESHCVNFESNKRNFLIQYPHLLDEQ